eukprot:gene33875-45378_t
MVITLTAILISLSFFHFLFADDDTQPKIDGLKYLRQFGEAVKDLKKSKSTTCPTAVVGTGWGAHTVCDSPVPKDIQCRFLSFGISVDWSFDTAMYEKYGCEGFAADPTQSHPVKLTPGVIFLKAGANTRLNVPKSWSLYSPVELQKFIRQPLFILKMDCEGCEYSIAPDVLKYDANFFDKVYQFNVEVHTPRDFLPDAFGARSLGKLYYLLKKAGLELIHSDGTGCGVETQAKGCVKALTEAGFPCEPGCQRVQDETVKGNKGVSPTNVSTEGAMVSFHAQVTSHLLLHLSAAAG